MPILTGDASDQVMSNRSSRAPAKVNLTLKVHGKRPDGYHELTSLVAFAEDVCDVVHIAFGTETLADRVSFTGPFGSAVPEADNTASRVLAAVRAEVPELRHLTVAIEKRIPLASGLGGGSADAAAIVRVLHDLIGPGQSAKIDWTSVAKSIGADVPVCIASRAQVMSGVGERLNDIRKFPPVYAVLMTPLSFALDNKTKRVFEHLNAEVAVTSDTKTSGAEPSLKTPADVVSCVSTVGNDLLPAASELMPEIAIGLSALSAQSECMTVSLSGAGPTVFGLFLTEEKAAAAADLLQKAEPEFLLTSSRLI